MRLEKYVAAANRKVTLARSVEERVRLDSLGEVVAETRDRREDTVVADMSGEG